MEESTAGAFANRDEPLPLLTVTYDDVDAASSDTDASRVSRRSRIRRRLSAGRLREKAQELHAVTSEKVASSPGRPSLQDRLFNKLLEQVIPTGEVEEAEEVTPVDRRSSKYVSRPPFSLGTMSTNFRRFNARIGIVFVFQNRLIRLFTWRTTSHTVSFLAIYTFICLDPYLLIVLPLAGALLSIMVSAFVARHPPPPAPSAPSAKVDQFTVYNYSGPPIAPARTIKPAAETSKDFFRNMRDLQNSMADFSNAHDALVTYVAPLTNFSDEILSSMVFVYMFLLMVVLFISAHLLPFRAIFLLGGYAAIISGHPRVHTWAAAQHKKMERQAAASSDSLQPPASSPKPGELPMKPATPHIYGIPIPNNATTRMVQSTLTAMSEIALSSAPETAEVEIFELQHRPLVPAGSAPASASLYHPRPHSTSADEWHHHLYTPTPYDPLSPARIAGSRPKGTRFFEDVQPPAGWTWHTPKWELDLEVSEWVADRLIVGVEYDVMRQGGLTMDHRRESVNADFGGWCWDLPLPATDTKTGLERDEEVWLAYGDYDLGDHDAKEDRVKDKKAAKAQKNRAGRGEKDWEEQIKYGGRGKTGEWRRRRWVRVVRRRRIASHDEK